MTTSKRTRRSTLVLTNTSKATFLTCERKYYWRYERCLELKAKPEVMMIGTLFHQGIAVLLDGAFKKEALKKALKAVRSSPYLEPAMTAEFLVQQYYDRYALKNEWKVLWTEKTLKAPVEKGLTLAGKVDGLIEKDGDPWILEVKTTSNVDNDYLAKVALDGQLTTYMYLVHAALGVAPAGVIYDVTCRPRIYRRQDENLKLYLSRAAVDYKATPLAFFAQQLAFRSVDSLAEFPLELRQIRKRVEACQQSRVWCKNDSVCFIRGRTCPFVPLCSDGEKPQILAEYEKVDPHQELEGSDVA